MIRGNREHSLAGTWLGDLVAHGNDLNRPACVLAVVNETFGRRLSSFRIAPGGGQQILLENVNTAHLERVEQAYGAGTMAVSALESGLNYKADNNNSGNEKI